MESYRPYAPEQSSRAEAHQIIVAPAVSNHGIDAEHFEPMLNRIVHNCDAIPALTTDVAAAEHMAPNRLSPWASVEPVFGQIRACRSFRQLSFRGLLKTAASGCSSA